MIEVNPMNIEQRLEAGEVITNEEMQRAVSGNPPAYRQGLVDSGHAKCTEGWKNITSDRAIARTKLDPAQDTKEAQAAQQRLRKIIGGIVLEALNKRQLTESHFYRITRRDETYWSKWLAYQLKNDGLVLKDEVYRPGPQWAISLVSMR
jgi:F0F1-type ATP synthase epsilon subunit